MKLNVRLFSKREAWWHCSGRINQGCLNKILNDAMTIKLDSKKKKKAILLYGTYPVRASKQGL